MNSEHCKGKKDNEEQLFLECLSEETLISLLENRVDVAQLRDLLRKCGATNVSGLSRLQCISRLKKLLEEKIWTQSGKVFFPEKTWDRSKKNDSTTCQPHTFQPVRPKGNGGR